MAGKNQGYQPNYEHEILKVFHTRQAGNRYRVDLMVIWWKSAKNPTLENRRMYYDDEWEAWVPRKQIGMGKEELEIILEHQEEIRQLLSTPCVEKKEEKLDELNV